MIAYEYFKKEYYAAAGTIVHALFDLACMLGGNIGFDVVGILSSGLERAGLGCVSRFFGMIHDGIHDLIHYIGIEHAHGPGADEAVEPLVKKVEELITPETEEVYCQPVSSGRPSTSTPGSGWTTHKHGSNCKHS